MQLHKIMYGNKCMYMYVAHNTVLIVFTASGIRYADCNPELGGNHLVVVV